MKLFFELLGGRRSHAQDWWPSLQLNSATEGQPGEIVYKGKRVAPLLTLDALGRGQAELTIVGSGPSIAGQDFSAIPDSSALLLNGAIHLLSDRLRSCHAVLVEDERFVWRHFAGMEKLVPPQTCCLFSTGTIRAICEIDPGWLSTQRVIHLDFLQKPYRKPQPTLQELETLPFLRWLDSSALSLAPRLGLFAGGSVATTAIQIALDCKPGSIGLAGLDLANASEPRFYETNQNAANSGISQAEQRILKAFAIARQECDERGIALLNYSPVSSLSTIGVPYDDRLSPAPR